MKKQVVVIHGGHALDTHEDFLARLKNKEVTAENFKNRIDWKDNLEKNLGADFEVFTPRMPNGQNARYEEWKVWFEKMIPFLGEEVMLVGHSLGALFLVKYLSETIFPKKIKALFLVAAPYEGKGGKHARNDNFFFYGDLMNVEKQTENIFLFHSKDDKIVPYIDFENYQKMLPTAKAVSFEDRGHFNTESFPELVELIKKQF